MTILVRRSNLVVRIVDTDKIGAAWRHNADAITLDPGDGVDAAGGWLKEAIASAGQGAAEVFVRMKSGSTAAEFAAVVSPGLRGIMLAHLSETNNTPAHALSRTRDALRRSGWRRDALWVAHQTQACGSQGTSSLDTSAPVQLLLGF